MPEKILLAQSELGASPPLYELLRTEGYYVLKASTLSQAAELIGESPALLLLDRHLAHGAGEEAWKTLERECRKGDIRCLQIAPWTGDQGEGDPADSWVCGTIRLPAEAGEVLEKIDSQLTIRRLSYELALVHARLKEKQLETREHNRSAAQIQRSLLPARFPRVDSLRFAWRFIPWEQVGGDLFNVFQLDENTVAAYLFDVSGHGIPSAMVTVSIFQSLSLHTGNIVKKSLDAEPFYEILSPSRVLHELDLEYPLERFGKFFTISYLLLDTATGGVRYSNAGHPPPILVRADGTSETLSEGGSIIGLGERVPFEEGRVTLGPGDRLYLYSDGITEFQDTGGAFFGANRLVDKLRRLGKRSLDAACESVIDCLETFGRGSAQKDDMTLLGIEYLGRR
jgi:sigma-B regulation protein RsbU (phosphoserine phosphatase)